MWQKFVIKPLISVFLFFVSSILAQDQTLPMLPPLVGSFNVGVGHLELIESVTKRPLVIYSFYLSLKSEEKKATLQFFGLLNEELKNNWRENFKGMDFIDIDWTIKFLEKTTTELNLNSSVNSPPQPSPFPLFIFQTGTMGATRDYAFFLEQVASKGIIVLSVERPVSEGHATKILYIPAKKRYEHYKKNSEQDYLLRNFPKDGDYSSYIFQQVFLNLDQIASQTRAYASKLGPA